MRTRKRWLGLILGVALFVAAVGAALAVTVFQVSREVDAELVLSAVEVLADENLGVYWDRELTDPVTFIEFQGAAFEPPLRPGVKREWVYVVNHSDKELVLIEPCRGISGPDGENIADIHGGLHDLDGEWLGGTCDRDVSLAPGEVVWAFLHIDIIEGLEAANYAFVAVFGAVGADEERPALGINTKLGEVPIIEQLAPGFTLELFDGRMLALSELRGEMVMVHFWASWCPPCRQEAPVLAAVYEEYQSKGVVFIGINIWDSRGEALKYVDLYGITYPNGLDEKGATAIEYGVMGIPEKYFIDWEGTVMKKFVGPMDEERLREVLDGLLVR